MPKRIFFCRVKKAGTRPWTHPPPAQFMKYYSKPKVLYQFSAKLLKINSEFINKYKIATKMYEFIFHFFATKNTATNKTIWHAFPVYTVFAAKSICIDYDFAANVNVFESNL